MSKGLAGDGRGHWAVSAGAVAGVWGRYVLDGWVQQWWSGLFPAGTLVVNLAGCLLIGIVQSILLAMRPVRRDLQLLLVTGLIGGFTTFSTVSVQTIHLIEARQTGAALAYQGLSLVGGLAAVLLGGAIVGGMRRLVAHRADARQ